MRPLIVLSLMALAAFSDSEAAAQTRPGFWEVSVRAAAQAGLDSPVAPLILENALNIAESQDPHGVRAILSKLQLILSYVWANKLDLYKTRFGNDKFSIDTSTFEPGLRDYLPTLSTLVNTYRSRLFRLGVNDEEMIRTATIYGAKNFARLAVAIRKKVAPDDPVALADALIYEGLVIGMRNDAEDDYNEAMYILAALRRDLNAIARADQAFSVGENADRESPEKNFLFSDSAQIIFMGLSLASTNDLDDALDKKDQETVNHIIDELYHADHEQQKINSFLNKTWTCSKINALNHYWRARLYQREIKAITNEKSDDAEKSRDAFQNAFEEANAAFRTTLEIELFSAGNTDDLKSWANEYVDFLNVSGHGEEAKKVRAQVAALQQHDIGTGGPKEWRSDVDCEHLSM